MTENGRKKFSITTSGYFLLVVIFSVTTLLSVSAAFISPADYWVFALFGLAFHYVYPVNLLLLVVSILKRKKIFIFSFIPFLLGIHTVQGVFQLNLLKNKIANDSSTVKVMSFNTRLFDLYNWSNSSETRRRIFNMLKSESPDILCLQEFYSSDKKPLNNLDTLITFLKANYYHVEYPVTLRGSDHWGIATFSAFPVFNRGVAYFGKRNGNVCIYTDVVAHGDTVRIFNTHLESIRFRKEDYRFIRNIENSDEDETLRGSRNILLRMRRAYRKRAAEAELIDSLLTNCPYKHILCGDFNDPPASYTYAVISENMKDAFRESGSGFGETYIGPFPAYRIDYIFHDKSIRSYNYRKVDEKVSDHYPITCDINLH
jgi:endonuclease/exonuclease/phosphatase family metal-dependent hydrolase